MKNKLVLIDGNAILHRAYHAIPDLTNQQGEHTNAVYGFISILLRLITDLKPTHLVVAFDEKEWTFRKKDFKAYQAKRPKMDPWLASQIEKTRDFLDAAKVAWYSKGGFEADDIIGTITDQVEANPAVDEVVVVTGDRDLFQLIGKKVKIFVPKSMSQGKIYDEAEVVTDYNFTPQQVPDYKALVGDVSDNYPGVTGIGPKTAVELLRQYRSVEEIYANLDKIETRVRTKLEAGKQEAVFFKHLATIFKEVPIKFDLAQASQWDLGGEKALNQLKGLGFKSLTERVGKMGVKSEEKIQTSLF